MREKLMREVAALNLPLSTGANPAVTDGDLEGLPGAVQRYLRFMGVVGRPRDWSFGLGYTGLFRRSRTDRWMKCEAWQYNSRLSIARIFHIRIRIGGVVPILARDTYVAGRGRLLVRLLDRFTVGDWTGQELDLGELVTYLNDGILIAPSMLLVPEVHWSSVDERSFDVALTDRDHTVTARVFVDDHGAPIDFSTTDRFIADPADPKRLVRARWTTPVEGWQTIGDRRVWTRGRAVFHPPDGDFAYADFKPIAASLAFNLSATDRLRPMQLARAPLAPSASSPI
jgi:hypothetical protein